MLYCLFASSSTLAITPEELFRLSEKGAAEKRLVDKQLNLSDLHYQITADEADDTIIKQAPETIKKHATENRSSATVKIKDTTVSKSTTQSMPTPKSHKYTNNRREHPQNIRNARRSDAYNPKSASVSTALPDINATTRRTIFSDAVESDTKRRYGIRRGTWIRAEIRRNINNAEPGDVELYLSQVVHGDKKSLPADTQLFAAKALNSGTRRLDMITTYAITPGGREFELKARIYDTLKVSGLMGIIDIDESKIAERGTSSALASLGTSVLGELGGKNPIGRGLAAGGQSIIKDGQRASQLDTQQQITIFVAPQPVLLRVEETF